MHKIEQLLANVSGSTFIGIDTVTVPVLSGGKQNPYQGRVHKITIGSNVMVFTNKTTNAYDNMVRRRLVAEGKDPESFVLSPRTWGERLPDTPFVQHKGDLYLEVIFLRAGATHYEVDGCYMDKDHIHGLKEPSTPVQSGLTDKVIVRTINVDNIKQITVNKQTHTLY